MGFNSAFKGLNIAWIFSMEFW